MDRLIFASIPADVLRFEVEVYQKTGRMISQIPDGNPGEKGETVLRRGATRILENDGGLLVINRTPELSPFEINVSLVVVLWRNPNNGFLCSLPYSMKLGQNPHEIGARYRCESPMRMPGDFAWGELSMGMRRALLGFHAVLSELELVPQRPGEWVNLRDPDGKRRAAGEFGTCY